MTILLITGLPGSGKTLRALSEADRHTKEGRQVYVSNVTGLTRTDWKECDPTKWMDLPDGSVVLLDEAQDFFPQRGPRDPIPEAVQRLDKHRHRGFIFIFTCQYPKQIDFALRGFVDQHIHMRRTFGLPNSVAMELNRVMDIDDKGDLNKAIKTTFRYPKEVFSWYQSATVHNMKVRLPAKVLAFPVLVLGFLGLVWFAYVQISGFGEKLGVAVNPNKAVPLGAKPPGQAQPQTAAGDVNLMAGAAQVKDVSSFKAYQPRVPGLAFTAPRYDDVAKPARAPYPAACIVNVSQGCKCYTQQATPYRVSDELCRQFAANGFFLDFDPDGRQGRSDRQDRRQAAETVEVKGMGGLSVFESPVPAQQVASRFGGGK